MIGGRIRELREASGMSQSDLARAAGIPRQLVSRWENGVHEPGAENLRILRRVLGVSLDKLMEEEEK